MKKLLIFLDELYFKDGRSYVSNFAAGSFFKDINLVEKTFLIPVSNSKQLPNHFSTQLDSEQNNIVELPEWNSTIDYLKLILKSKEKRKQIELLVKQVVDSHDVLWIRTPSLLGLKLIEEGIKQEKKVIVHHAGDIENAWRNSKYGGSQKAMAFALSKYMHSNILKKAKNNHTHHLCTGSKLLNDFLPINKNTQFFIDTMIDKNELSSHDFDKNTKQFVYLGKLTQEKGVIDLMQIFEELNEKYSNIKLKIIGFGEEESKIKSIIKQSKNPSLYEFIGQVPNHEVANHLKTSDYLILPSKAPTEGFPRVIMEAWAQGLLVVSNRVGGVDGIGQNEKNILFSDIGNLNQLKSHVINIIEDQIDIQKMQDYILNNRNEITYQYQKELAELVINGL